MWKPPHKPENLQKCNVVHVIIGDDGEVLPVTHRILTPDFIDTWERADTTNTERYSLARYVSTSAGILCSDPIVILIIIIIIGPPLRKRGRHPSAGETGAAMLEKQLQAMPHVHHRPTLDIGAHCTTSAGSLACAGASTRLCTSVAVPPH